MMPSFTGIGSAYGPPEQAEIVLAAGQERPQALADRVLATLQQRGVILWKLRRHARARRGHPRLSRRKQDVDGRDRPGHDADC
jgi:hypothetical protein